MLSLSDTTLSNAVHKSINRSCCIDKSTLRDVINIREHYPSPQASSYYSLPEHRAVSILTNTIVDLPFGNVLCQAKVTDLNHAFILHQNIPCSQIPVDVPFGVQIVHPLWVQQYR